jgi:hypothetical protein
MLHPKPACGVYIAHHRWLDLDYGPGQLYKVGHTADLGARLGDGAYATCFPPGWRYIATFELPTREEAALLETAVLHCCRHRRVEGRELVRASADELLGVAVAAAEQLALRAIRRDAPTYSGRRAAAGTAGPAVPGTAWAEKRATVEPLTLAAQADLSD